MEFFLLEINGLFFLKGFLKMELDYGADGYWLGVRILLGLGFGGDGVGSNGWWISYSALMIVQRMLCPQVYFSLI